MREVTHVAKDALGWHLFFPACQFSTCLWFNGENSLPTILLKSNSKLSCMEKHRDILSRIKFFFSAFYLFEIAKHLEHLLHQFCKQ